MARRGRGKPISWFARRPRQVLVSADSPMAVQCVRPLLDVMLDDPRVTVYLSGKSKGRYDAAELAERAGVRGVELLSKPDARKFQGHLHLTSDATKYGKRCQRRVLMFHGASFKGHAIRDRALWFDRILLVGPYQRRRFVSRGIFEAEDPRLVDVGFPKLDQMVRGEIDVDALRKDLGIARDQRIVLYAPTWNEQSSLFTMGEELIGELSRAENTHVLVKFHDHALDPSISPIDWEARSALWTWPNVSIYRGIDASPALALADVLVTDASSVAQEFTLLNRPILFVDVPELFHGERYRDTSDLKTWGRRGGITIAAADEALAALQQCYDEPDELASIRSDIANDVFYNPGHATERALKAVYRELALRRPR